MTHPVRKVFSRAFQWYPYLSLGIPENYSKDLLKYSWGGFWSVTPLGTHREVDHEPPQVSSSDGGANRGRGEIVLGCQTMGGARHHGEGRVCSST